MLNDMNQTRFVPYNDSHLNDFVQMNTEYITWICDSLLEHYNLDALPYLEGGIPKWVEDRVDHYTKLGSPEGNLYIIETSEGIAGMGAIQKLSPFVGEVKGMYNRPEFRGNGYGKQMFNLLLEEGKKFGCTSFKLDTPKWAYAAQHIYKSAGFNEREIYPESEIPPILHPYWMWMEKLIE